MNFFDWKPNRTQKLLAHLTVGGSTLFKKDGIQKDGCAHEHGLALNGSATGEMDVKSIGIGQDFRRKGLGALDNFSHMRGIGAIGIFGGRIKDPKGHDAATAAETGVPFSTAVDANAPGTTGWWMNLVDRGSGRIENVKHGDTEIAGFLNRPKLIGIAGKGGGLIAATFTRSHATLERTIDAQQFGIRTHFLYAHGKRMNVPIFKVFIIRSNNLKQRK
jgi:hypothetical protein